MSIKKNDSDVCKVNTRLNIFINIFNIRVDLLYSDLVYVDDSQRYNTIISSYI